MLCELAATGDERVAVALLTEHRAGLALLWSALDHARSPYVAVVDAVQTLLPPVDPAAARVIEVAASQLAVCGPQTEAVGLPGRLTPFLPGVGAGADDNADARGARR